MGEEKDSNKSDAQLAEGEFQILLSLWRVGSQILLPSPGLALISSGTGPRCNGTGELSLSNGDAETPHAGEKVIGKEENEEEEEECGFCIFMKGGGCKEAFTVCFSPASSHITGEQLTESPAICDGPLSGCPGHEMLYAPAPVYGGGDCNLPDFVLLRHLSN